MTTPDRDDPDEIRRDIERTQAALSRDVDVLTEKVSPGRIVERRVGRVRTTLGRWKDNVMGSAPTPHGHHSAAQRATDAVSSARDGVGGAVSDAADAVQGAPAAARQQARGNPLAAGVIAFGVGWLVSSLIPATRREREVAEQARERATELGRPLAEKAGEVAGEVRDNLAGPARQAAESVQATAADAGRTVADEGRAAARRVQHQTRESAGAVRQSGSE